MGKNIILTNNENPMIARVSTFDIQTNLWNTNTKLNVVARLHGFTQDPCTLDYMIVMKHIRLEDLKKLCPDCCKLYTDKKWCIECNTKRFQQEFPNWSSGNELIDKFIQETQLDARHGPDVLEWIPYSRFKNIEYLSRKEFSTVYKATWLGASIRKWSHNKGKWDRFNIKFCSEEGNIFVTETEVVLKRLNNSCVELLNKWIYHYDCILQPSSPFLCFIYLYGFTQDPITKDYMIVLQYEEGGSLRKNLPDIVKCKWESKLNIIEHIICGLYSIHKLELVHCNFHDSKILGCDVKNNKLIALISDLGLSQPANSSKESKIYGILPFVAPEVLRGEPYTPASDIYSLSMIMWEFTSGIRPFNNEAYDVDLALRILEGKRPKIIEHTPQPYIDLMKKCWDDNPLKRPTASEVWNTIGNWRGGGIRSYNRKIFDAATEFQKADEIDEEEVLKIIANTLTESHPQAYDKSRDLSYIKESIQELKFEISSDNDE